MSEGKEGKKERKQVDVALGQKEDYWIWIEIRDQTLEMMYSMFLIKLTKQTLKENLTMMKKHLNTFKGLRK